MKIEPVENYKFYKYFESHPKIAQKSCRDSTPGPLNSAYYEHSFLADMMGVELVQGSDLYVDQGITYMKTTRGREKVDIFIVMMIILLTQLHSIEIHVLGFQGYLIPINQVM